MHSDKISHRWISHYFRLYTCQSGWRKQLYHFLFGFFSQRCDRWTGITIVSIFRSINYVERCGSNSSSLDIFTKVFPFYSQAKSQKFCMERVAPSKTIESTFRCKKCGLKKQIVFIGSLRYIVPLGFSTPLWIRIELNSKVLSKQEMKSQIYFYCLHKDL